MSCNLINKKIFVLILLFLLYAGGASFAQKYKWMSVGSLQDWYSSIGGEREEGITDPQTGSLQQQTGWQWPADHKFMDSKAMSGLWIGAKNFTDKAGNNFPAKVVHVGPRVSGSGEFFPIKFFMKSKYPKPAITVEGNNSISLNDADVDVVDPTMAADREIVSVSNTQLGLTVTRRIFQFTQAFHDNYIIQEYTLTNTGDTDGDTTTIELPNQTLQGVTMFIQFRIAPCAYSRNVIGNGTGWGMNTTIDTRGDGVKPDPQGENFRAQFAWHGKFPAFTGAGGDNIGGPIWTVQTNVTKNDTIGRLAAFQFVGMATLYADKSATEKVDDPSQPTTTNTFDSDGPLESQNDAMNTGKMGLEYQMMTSGHDKRHLDKIGETNIIMPTKDPSLGTGGGYSFGNGYGPYTLKHGESVKIVLCQASAGMGWEAGQKVGVDYKAGRISLLQKNTEVFKGKDSLFTTFRRAMDNYNKGWNLPSPPAPPKTFNVDGLGDRVALSWSLNDEGDPNTTGFQVWRATGRRDSTYNLLSELPASARSYDDRTAPRGVDCYYQLRVIGKTIDANPALNIPATRLVSNKFFTQTYDPATLKRPPVDDMNRIRVVPNPFSLGANPTKLNFPDKRDRIYFYEIPGNCTIKIYTEYGELINTIDHTNGSGDQAWDCVTSSNQLIVTGIYLAVVKNNDTGESKIVKFVVIR